MPIYKRCRSLLLIPGCTEAVTVKRDKDRLNPVFGTKLPIVESRSHDHQKFGGDNGHWTVELAHI